MLRSYRPRLTSYVLTGIFLFACAGQASAEDEPVGRLVLGLGYNLDAGLSFVGGLQHNALMGLDQSIDLAFALSSREQSYSMEYRFDALVDASPTFVVLASHAEQDRRERQGLETTVSRFAPAVIWNLGGLGSAAFGPVFVHDELRASANAPLMLQSEAGTRSLMGFSLGGDLSIVDVDLGFSAAVLDDGQDLRYSKIEVSLGYAFSIPLRKLAAGIAIRGGAIGVASGQTTLNDRFIPASGAIRGFGANGFGPVDATALDGAPIGATRYSVMSFDVRYAGLLPSAPKAIFGVFVDFGSAWGLDLAGNSSRAAIDAETYWRGAAGFTIGRDFGASRIELVFGDAFARRPSDIVQNVQINFSSTF